MSPPPKRPPLPTRPIGPPQADRRRPQPATATSFDEIERRQRQGVNRLLFDGPATPSLGDRFGHINVDGTIELDSPERYIQRVGGEQAYRFPVPLPEPHYPPGQGPTVPNNSPASDFDFSHSDDATNDDGYKDEVTNEEKMEDLNYVANGNNAQRKNNNFTKDHLNFDSNGNRKELPQFLQLKEKSPNKPKNKKKAPIEVNWFTTARGKQVKVNLPSTHTSKDKDKEKEMTTDESTFVDNNSDIDTDSEGGVAISLQEQL